MTRSQRRFTAPISHPGSSCVDGWTRWPPKASPRMAPIPCTRRLPARRLQACHLAWCPSCRPMDRGGTAPRVSALAHRGVVACIGPGAKNSFGRLCLKVMVLRWSSIRSVGRHLGGRDESPPLVSGPIHGRGAATRGGPDPGAGTELWAVLGAYPSHRPTRCPLRTCPVLTVKRAFRD